MPKLGGRRRGIRRALGIASLAAVLPACWAEVGGSAANMRDNGVEAGLTRANAASVAVDWRRPTTGSLSEPVVLGGLLYVAAAAASEDLESTAVSAVQAYDAGSGNLVWERSLLPSGVKLFASVQPVAVIDGAVWVPYTNDALPACTGRLARLDPGTGAVLSDVATGAPAGPVVSSGSIVVAVEEAAGCRSEQLVVRDLASRSTLWTYTFPEGSAVTDPTVAGDKILVEGGVPGPNGGGRDVYAFATAGCGAPACQPSWHVSEPGERAELDRLVAGPDGLVYEIAFQLGTGGGFHFRALDTATGALRWRSEARYGNVATTGLSGLAVHGDSLFLAGLRDNRSGTVDRYAAAGCGQPTCTPTWSVDLGPDISARATPLAAGGMIWFGTNADSGHPPAVIGVDDRGCGAAACTPTVTLPLEEPGPGAFEFGSGPREISLSGGRIFVASSLPAPSGNELIAVHPTAP